MIASETRRISPQRCPDCRVTASPTMASWHLRVEPGAMHVRSAERHAADLSREVLDLFDGFVHGQESRRGFANHCAAYACSTAAAGAILEALSPNFAAAQLVTSDDKRIRLSHVEIPSPGGSGSIRVYVAKPTGASTRARTPVVLVVHGNRGLNPHIEDIARRLAVDGFIAVAPMRSPSSAVIRATRTRRASCSERSTRPRSPRNSSRRRAARGRSVLRVAAGDRPSASDQGRTADQYGRQ